MAAVEIAKEMISFDTSGPPAKEKPLAVWISDFLEDLGAEVTIQEVEPDRANVVGKFGLDKGPGLLLSGHIDVVPSGEISLWKQSSPFDPVVNNGKLYGRGSVDMKGPDACILQAAKDFAKSNFKRRLVLAFTAGEDTGGWFVTRVIDDKLVTRKDARFGVIPEPSMMSIVRTHKGSGGASVGIHGRASHSSRPELGINAILNASDYIQELNKLQRQLAKTRHPLLGYTTIKPTLIKGGFKSNIIPDYCEITINVRTIPRHSKSSVLERWLQKISNKLAVKDPTFKAEIRNVQASTALNVSENAEIVTILRDLLGTKPVGVPYYTEAVSYTNSGIPTVICGPGDIAQAHSPDEYITLEQLAKGTRTFHKLIEKTCL